LKIGQYFAKIWTKVCGLLFWATLYVTLPGMDRVTGKHFVIFEAFAFTCA